MKKLDVDWINQFKKILVIRKREETRVSEWGDKELVLQELENGSFKIMKGDLKALRTEWKFGKIGINIFLTDEALAKAVLMSWI